jgi:3-oxoacyl-[acyl-carrier protein] reductase
MSETTNSTESGRLAGRTIIVTGAARGIGLAIAQRLLADGARVMLTDLDRQALDVAAKQLADGDGSGNVRSHAGDVTVSTDVDELVTATTDAWGGVDGLVNNAAIAGPAKPVWDYSEREWGQVLSINLTGIFLTTKAVLPQMIERGSGRIVNIASISGKEGNPNMAAYSTSKAAVLGFTKAVAKEVAQLGVYVNAITPAVIETEMLQQLTPEAVQYMVNKIPMGRTGQPHEVAAMVAWLCSDECSFSTGAVFDISGGRATY